MLHNPWTPYPWNLSLLIAVVLGGTCRAEQEVTLRSGTRLIGAVSVVDDTAVVKIDDTELTIPLRNIDLIAPVGTDAASTPERLLLIALEARLQNHSGEGLRGLLAEAHRLAPENPRIAYWYAQSLVDAGLGQAASQVFRPMREEIEQAYPGLAEQLAAAINDRLVLAKLPADLLRRLDRVGARIGQTPPESNEIPTFTRFRLLDQHRQPIPESAFEIQCHGSDERLEAFGDGYYLFTFNRYRNNFGDSNCRLQVAAPGLEAKEIPLLVSSEEVADAGDILVQRYEDDAKLPVQFTVVDRDDQPLVGATVTLRPATRQDAEDQQLSETTDRSGRVEFHAFPMSYTYSVEADGFNPERRRLELVPGKAPEDRRISLYRVLTGTVQIAWETNSPESAGGTTSGRLTLDLSKANNYQPSYGHNAALFVRPVQEKDTMQLHIGEPSHYGAAAGGPWVSRFHPEKTNPDNATARAQFEAMDLNRIDTLKAKSEPVAVNHDPRRGPPGMLQLPIQAGVGVRG